MPYKAKGKCVYRADTGKKVGCTKGPVSKYLAALHANVKTEDVNESANSPENYQSAINAFASEFVMNAGIRSMVDDYSPEEVIAIIYGKETNKVREELKQRIQQKLTKRDQRGIRESTCRACGGDGWYVEPDEHGNPKQVQCSACLGTGGTKDPEPRLRPSGEPEHEPFNEELSSKSPCKSCGKYPCHCLNLSEIIKRTI